MICEYCLEEDETAKPRRELNDEIICDECTEEELNRQAMEEDEIEDSLKYLEGL